MNYRQLLISLILALVLPASSFASEIASTHCQTSDNSSHTTHAHMDEDQHQHMQDHMSSEAIDNHNDCECGCDGSVNCSVSGCSAAALLNVVSLDTINLIQKLYLSAEALAFPPDAKLLLRPPISLS